MISPERLRQIRFARSLTFEDLASRMGGMVTKQALSQYENGKAQPRPAVLLQLARALSVSTNELSTPALLTVEFIAFRRKSGMTQEAETRLKSSVAFDLEKRVQLQQLVQRPAHRSFSFQQISVSRIEEAEAAALQIREYMGLGRDAIGNLTETLELHGVHVFSVDAADKFDGISALVKQDGEVIATGIATRAGLCGERERFTRAHEVGHLFVAPKEGLDAEKVSHRFAGALLLPERTLREEVGSRRTSLNLQELLTLKRRYGISIAALVMRMRDLNIVTALYAEECFKTISRNGWRKSEPQPCAPETSSWLRQNVLRAHSEGLLSTHDAEAMLNEKIVGELPALTRLKAFRQLSLEEKNRVLAQEAQELAELYRDDLAKPPAARELTAFMVLDGIDPILESEAEEE